MKKLVNKVAIITGASKGIGASIAEHLAAEGTKVIVNYASSKEDADKVVANIQSNGGEALAIQADISKLEDIHRLFEETKSQFGRVDILVNNAGIYEFSPLEQITPDHVSRHFNLNVFGLLFTTQKATEYFGENGGSIINISSVVSKTPFAGASVYSATKASVDAFTTALSKELGTKKIRINSILPGMVETEGTHTAGVIGSDLQKQMVAQTPLGRIGNPSDIGKVAAFLASEDAGWITGETIVVSGGNI